MCPRCICLMPLPALGHFGAGAGVEGGVPWLSVLSEQPAMLTSSPATLRSHATVLPGEVSFLTFLKNQLVCFHRVECDSFLNSPDMRPLLSVYFLQACSLSVTLEQQLSSFLLCHVSDFFVSPQVIKIFS